MATLCVKQYWALFIILLSMCSTKTEVAKKFRAIFAFGDSVLDTGNNNNLVSLSKANFPPYGIDFVGGRATGRFSDGKVLSDLIAEGLGIKDTVPPYLGPSLQVQDFTTGVCFASGGSGMDTLTVSLQGVIPMSNQLKYFEEYIGKLKQIVEEENADRIISNSLFLLSAGNNDIAVCYFSLPLPVRPLQYTQDTYTTALANDTSEFIKNLYQLGVRNVAVFSTMPLGCLPAVRTLQGVQGQYCANEPNNAAQILNSRLSSEVNYLSRSLPEAKIVYVDVYNPLLDLIKNPTGSGFNVADRGCCGTGRIEIGLFCNQFSSICENVSQYIFWDSSTSHRESIQIYDLSDPSKSENQFLLVSCFINLYGIFVYVLRFSLRFYHLLLI